MPRLSEPQIEQMFRDFGLGTEAERQRVRALAMLSGSEHPMYNFIRLDDTSSQDQSGEQNAELA